MVRRRHRAEVRQVRLRVQERARRGGDAAAARRPATRRCIASASGSSSRVSGHREVDGMIAQHAAMARALAEQLGLPDDGARRARRGLRAVGRARLAGRAEGRRRSRSPSRLAQLAEFVEVAHRVGGIEAATALAREAQRQAVRSRARRARLRATRTRSSAGLDSVEHVGRGDRRRAGARGRAVRRPVRRRAGGDRQLRRPEVAVHARPLARGRRSRRRSRRRSSGCRTTRCARCAAPGSCTTSAGSACRTRSGTSAGRSARASGSACGCTRT